MPYTLTPSAGQPERTYQGQDFNLFLTKTFFTRSYFLASTDSTTQSRYLKDERGSQGLYLPIGVNAMIRATAVIWSTAGTGALVISADSHAISRDDTSLFLNGAAGAATIGSASTIPGETAGNVTLQIARNNSVLVKCFEFAITKSTNAPTGLIRAHLVVEVFNYPFTLDTISTMARSAGTAALIVAE